MSVNEVTGTRLHPVTGQFAALSRDPLAGLITSTIAIAYGLSFAALIFAPPLTPWLAYGIAATFLTTAISAAIVAARGSLPFTIAGPDGATRRARDPRDALPRDPRHEPAELPFLRLGQPPL